MKQKDKFDPYTIDVGKYLKFKKDICKIVIGFEESELRDCEVRK